MRKRHLHTSPVELFAQERLALKPLPIWVPAVITILHRTVDSEGFINVNCNRYSVPYKLIGRQLEVHESKDRIEAFLGPRMVASHPKLMDPLDRRVTNPEHRPPKGEGRSKAGPSPEEVALLDLVPALADYVAALKAHRPGRAILLLKRLQGMAREYPRQPFLEAVATALAFGMYDLERLDRMVLKRINQDFFVLAEASTPEGGSPGGNQGDLS
jgi:hypothetical protein